MRQGFGGMSPEAMEAQKGGTCNPVESMNKKAVVGNDFGFTVAANLAKAYNPVATRSNS